jgi:ubiquinone/menaquinone biosynthesis C-methylase UbiE
MTNHSSRSDYKPALRFAALTSLFDPVVATMSRERAFKQRVVARATIAPGEVVLDLGCGTGTLALMAHADQPAADYTGLDADPAILKRARAKARAAHAAVTFDEGFATNLPYADAHFDVVLSTLVFHHLDDVAKCRAAEEVRRVLRPGGRLILADFGRPHDLLMRIVVGMTVQLLDGRTTTRLNVAGNLPTLLQHAGFAQVEIVDRLRTPTGTIDVITDRRAAHSTATDDRAHDASGG